jgi:hypothetical protein
MKKLEVLVVVHLRVSSEKTGAIVCGYEQHIAIALLFFGWLCVYQGYGTLPKMQLLIYAATPIHTHTLRCAEPQAPRYAPTSTHRACRRELIPRAAIVRGTQQETRALNTNTRETKNKKRRQSRALFSLSSFPTRSSPARSPTMAALDKPLSEAMPSAMDEKLSKVGAVYNMLHPVYPQRDSAWFGSDSNPTLEPVK